MNCHEVEDLIHPYIDGELDLVRSLEIEQHLAHCDACAAAHTRHLALRSAVRKHAVQTAPATLHQRLATALRSEPVAAPAPMQVIPPTRWRISPRLTQLAAAAVIVLTATLCWQILRQPSAATLLSHEIVSSHVRSLLANHLTDVASTDQHTVKPWFNGKLDFAPRVLDLSDEGFPLIGGRLDYLNGRTVAALVYQRGKHFINVFVWPGASGEPNSAPELHDLRGYHLVRFNNSGLIYFAVSDVDPTELDRLARLIQQPTTRSSAEEPR